MKEIVQNGHEVLRQTAKPVNIKDITGSKIKGILADMKKALDSQNDGVALASPQIAVSLRIFVVSEKAYDMQANPKTKKFDEAEGEKEEVEVEKKNIKKDFVFINPEIIKTSTKKSFMDEGCLSVRWLYGDVKRAERITVKAYDSKGNEFTRGAGGLMSQIFQHEIDHLNGILFIDKAQNIKEIIPEEEVEEEDVPQF